VHLPPVFPTVPGRVSKDGRANRPNLRKMAVLGVDGRGLQSLVRWVLRVVICRARPLAVGHSRYLQGLAVICRARPSSVGPCRARLSCTGGKPMSVSVLRHLKHLPSPQSVQGNHQDGCHNCRPSRASIPVRSPSRP